MMSSSNGVSITRARGVRSYRAPFPCLEREAEPSKLEIAVAAAATGRTRCRRLELHGRPLLPVRSPSLDRRRTYPLPACDAESLGSTLKRGPDALGPLGEYEAADGADHAAIRVIRAIRGFTILN